MQTYAADAYKITLPPQLAVELNRLSQAKQSTLYMTMPSVFSALLGTVQPFALGHAFHQLRVPSKLIHLFLFTLRYLDVLHHEYLSLLRALKARLYELRQEILQFDGVGEGPEAVYQFAFQLFPLTDQGGSLSVLSRYDSTRL